MNTLPKHLEEARTADLALERARILIKKKWPFVMSGVLALVPVPVDTQPTTFVTRGLVFGYNRNYMAGLTDSQAAFVTLHEYMHPHLDFFGRLDAMGMEMLEIANIAHDLVINVMLRNGGFDPPPNILFPAAFGFPEGLTMEEYIELLMKNAKQIPKVLAKVGGGGGGGGGKDKKEGEGEKHLHVCAGGCSNPSDGTQQELDQKYGRSQANVKSVKRKTNHDIKEASGHMPGKVPGELKELVDRTEHEESKIPWQARLDGVVHDCAGRIISGGDDFSMKHPSKRSHLRRILRPGLVDREIVALMVLDTSSSMQEPMLWAAIRETCAIFRALGIDEIYWMENDTDVALEPKLVSLDYFEKNDFEFHGRGGTDFRPPFEAVKRLDLDIDLMVFWTDGEGPAPKEAPDAYEVVWGIIPGPFYGRKPANWGHVVVVTDDPERERQIEGTFVEEEEDDY